VETTSQGVSSHLKKPAWFDDSDLGRTHHLSFNRYLSHHLPSKILKLSKYQYLQIVENRKEKGKVKQRVIATVGRMDQLQSQGRVETLIRSLSKFSEQALLIISGQSNIAAVLMAWTFITFTGPWGF
jgi:hypothetical protein